MKMTKVKSSNIEKIGYTEGNPSTLRVLFKNGSLYEYKNVEEYKYEDLMKSVSKGSFLNRNIVKNNYIFNKIKEIKIYKNMDQVRNDKELKYKDIFIVIDPQKRCGEKTYDVVIMGDGTLKNDMCSQGLFWKKPLAIMFAEKLQELKEKK